MSEIDVELDEQYNICTMHILFHIDFGHCSPINKNSFVRLAQEHLRYIIQPLESGLR